MLSRPLAGACWPPFASTSQCSSMSGGKRLAGLPCALLCLQTAKGEPAKGCTAEEWESVIAYFKGVVARAMLGKTWQEAAGRHRPWWSFDNDKIHQNRMRLAYLKINANNRFPLPPNSPDMHRVVERCIARLKGDFKDWLYAHPAKRDMAEYRKALLKLFKDGQTADVIDRKVKKLPKLWPFILRAQGGWPPKKQL